MKLADPAAEITEWWLEYAFLTGAESKAILSFFEEAEGTLNSFTFLDPVANLLSQSTALDENVWERDPLLAITDGVVDPFGGEDAWRIENTGGGAQSLTQTLQVPGAYIYSMSAYVRSSQTATVSLAVGATTVQREIGAAWRRIFLGLSGDPEADSIRFGLELPAATTLEVFGIQVEPQPAPSGYKATVAGGVYENARLADDVLTITATGENRHSCTVHIIHANHL